MKRKAITALILAAAAVVTAGCGSSGSSSASVSETKPVSASDGADNEKNTEASAERFTFEPSEEVKNAKLNEMKMQFGDVTFTLCSTTVGEFMEKLGKSDFKWDYEYDDGKQIGDCGEEKISFFHNGRGLVLLKCCNPSSKAAALKDCVIYDVTYSAPDDMAMPGDVVFYAGGISGKGTGVPDHSDYVKELEAAGISFTEASDSTQTAVKYTIECSGSFGAHALGVEFDKVSITAAAQFDKNTGKCVMFTYLDTDF